jgi:hypothetical protein
MLPKYNNAIEKFMKKLMSETILSKRIVGGKLIKVTKKIINKVPEINELIPDDTNEWVIIHNLNIRNVINYSNISNIIRQTSISRKLRIFKIGDNETWREMNNYEHLIYSKIINKLYDDKFAVTNQLPIYGILIDIPVKNNFYIVNKTNVDGSSKSIGKAGESFPKSTLIDILILLNANPPQVPLPSSIQQIIEYLLSRKDISQHIKLSISQNSMSQDNLIRYYSWITSSQSSVPFLSKEIQKTLQVKGLVITERYITYSPL